VHSLTRGAEQALRITRSLKFTFRKRIRARCLNKRPLTGKCLMSQNASNGGKAERQELAECGTSASGRDEPKAVV